VTSPDGLTERPAISAEEELCNEMQTLRLQYINLMKVSQQKGLDLSKEQLCQNF